MAINQTSLVTNVSPEQYAAQFYIVFGCKIVMVFVFCFNYFMSLCTSTQRDPPTAKMPAQTLQSSYHTIIFKFSLPLIANSSKQVSRVEILIILIKKLAQYLRKNTLTKSLILLKKKYKLMPKRGS